MVAQVVDLDLPAESSLIQKSTVLFSWISVELANQGLLQNSGYDTGP